MRLGTAGDLAHGAGSLRRTWGHVPQGRGSQGTCKGKLSLEGYRSQRAERLATASVWRCERHRIGTIVPGEKQKAAKCGGFSKAAGLGLEPRLPDSESGVLPLDDPAGRLDCSGARRDSELQLVQRDEAFLRLGVDVRDDFDVRLE